MSDIFRWKLSQGVPLSQGPPLSKTYNLKDPAHVFWNDFLGPCTWLYSLSGESGQAADSEGRMLRVMSVTGESDSLVDADGGQVRLRHISGTSQIEAAAKGRLNMLFSLAGDSATQVDGAGHAQRIRLIGGTSENIASWRNDYYWLLSQGVPLSQGPPLSKTYNLKDPAHVFWDDFLGPHRNFIVRLRSIAGDSAVESDSKGTLSMSWYLAGTSEAEVDSAGTLAVTWSLAGDSLTLTDGTGTLSMLWSLAGDSINITDSAGKPLRLRQISGESVVLTIGEGTILKWPVVVKLGILYPVIVKLGVERLNIIGNTVRLTGDFISSDGKYENPGIVLLRIYDGALNVIDEFTVQPWAAGRYRYDYTIPKEPLGPLYFEYVGDVIIMGNKPAVGRTRLERVWAEN